MPDQVRRPLSLNLVKGAEPEMVRTTVQQFPRPRRLSSRPSTLLGNGRGSHAEPLTASRQRFMTPLSSLVAYTAPMRDDPLL
jgi:hypothetical protein